MSAPGPARRERGLLEKLLNIVHGLEVIALAFGALAMWGVTRDWPAPAAFGAVALLLVLTTRLLRYPGGWVASALAQVAIGALSFIEPLMVVFTLAFGAMWVFCFVRARQIGRAHS